MNYYYEKRTQEGEINGEQVNIRAWFLCDPEGNTIALCYNEENANLVVTLMNGGQKTEEYTVELRP